MLNRKLVCGVLGSLAFLGAPQLAGATTLTFVLQEDPAVALAATIQVAIDALPEDATPEQIEAAIQAAVEAALLSSDISEATVDSALATVQTNNADDAAVVAATTTVRGLGLGTSGSGGTGGGNTAGGGNGTGSPPGGSGSTGGSNGNSSGGGTSDY